MTDLFATRESKLRQIMIAKGNEIDRVIVFYFSPFPFQIPTEYKSLLLSLALSDFISPKQLLAKQMTIT